jgi:intracellular multiplication protein IcmL
MRNQREAVAQRLSDPDFQGRLVVRCIGLTLAMAALLIMALGHSAYVWSNPPEPRYFFVDGRNPPRPVVALSSPIVDDAQLLDWTVRAVLAPYNVDYHFYPQQLNTASRRFTLHGWNTFANSFIGSGNFEQLKRASLLCHAQAQRAALITEALRVRGALAWRVQVPIVQTCANVNQTSTNNLMITALVVRSNAEAHVDGLAVEQLVATPR